MRGLLASFQATLVRGVFLLAPLLVLVVLGQKMFGVLHRVVGPLAGDQGALAGVPMPTLLAVVALVLICFLSGLLAKTAIAGRFVDWLETTVLQKIPAYAYMKGMGQSMAGVPGSTQYEPVLARIEDSWQLGYIVETIEPGQYAVFVPGAPSPWSGSVYFMAEARIRRVPLKVGQVQDCLKRQGIGSAALLRGKLQWDG